MTVSHSRGSYQVRFLGKGELMRDLPAGSFILTDERVASLYGNLLERAWLAVPEGEASKSLKQVEAVSEWLLAQGANRSSTVVAFGGGVVGDVAGFVAASYMRGVRLLQVPTTLLAQVDSSIGGKVGVDLPSGKNLVGAFWQPAEVRVCEELLSTLSERQFQNGMAEVWKYSFILDAPLFERMLSRVPPTMAEIVRRCIELKAKVVEADEFETTGERAILNFGHTAGHAIEQVTGYGPVLHGEAIAAGMVFEAKLGERLGITAPGTSDQVRKALSSIPPLPNGWPSDKEALLAAMKRDKKAKESGMAFSLLTHIGECKLVTGVSEADVRAVLKEE